MKKAAKRGKSTKRAPLRSKVKKAPKAKTKSASARSTARSSKSRTPSIPRAGSKLKRVAKKATAAAVVAAGTAALGTTLAELKPDQKNPENVGLAESGGNDDSK